MDVSNLTREEAQAAIQSLHARLSQLDLDELTASTDRASRISQARAQLDTLLGPEGAAPGVDSIRAVRAFDAADIAADRPRGTTMAENHAIALSLLFEGMEIQAKILRDIADALSND